MKTNDAITGLVLIIFAGAVFVFTQGAPTIHGSEIGSDLFPRIIASIMAICGLSFIGKEGVLLVKTGRISPLFEPPGWMRSRWHLLNFIFIIASLLAYILFSDLIGFPIICLAILFLLFSWLRQGHLVSSFAVALGTTMLIHYGFGYLLRVPLPWGILENYAFF